MRTLSLLLVLVAPHAGVAAAQDALEEAKAQYAAASYEEALSTLTRVAGAPPMNKVELEQYRAFCFIALGRMAEAEQAVASLVAADPRYVPSANVASPKVLSLVAEMRRKELPDVARRLLEEGLTAFKGNEFSHAQRRFDLLLELLDDAALDGRPESDDMRVLAEGFLALTNAAFVPPTPTTEPEPAVPTGTVIEAPVALEQPLPEWVPPDTTAGSREYSGAIKVLIGVDGRVKSAAIERTTYPTYDARLLQAARLWVYKPATRNGAPVESEKVIAIQLRRRN